MAVMICLGALLPKACADGNAAALDKALEALTAWLDKASEGAAARAAGTACSAIVSKALGARPATVARGLDCLMGFVAAEQAEKAMVRLGAVAACAATAAALALNHNGTSRANRDQHYWLAACLPAWPRCCTLCVTRACC
jgi:hypothetical protein